MPFTVNGCGTHYYGRRNESKFAGTCANCGRHAWLSSYDTRECICLLYIPLVPLRRYRISNECSLCTRHARIPLHEFNEQIELRIAPLRRDVERAPNRVETQLQLIAALLDYGMLKEAEEAARAALGHLPRETELKRVVGELISGRGDLKGAVSFLKDAASGAPRNVAARLALGRTLVGLKKWDEAAQELEEARRLDPKNVEILDLLADAHFQKARWTEALHLTEEIFRLRADLAAHPDLLARVKKCKQSMGYPLSESERKAGRWWSRGGKRGSAPAALVSMSGRQLAAAVAVIAVLAVAVAGGLALWRQNRVEVYFDNGLGKPVQFTVDGKTFAWSEGGGRPVVRALSPGPHSIVVTGSEGEIERFQAKIGRRDLMTSLFEPVFYVYNPSEAQVYSRTRLVYAEKAGERQRQDSLIGFLRFFSEPDVDYLFVTPPETIRTESRRLTKTAFTIVPEGYNELAESRYGEGKTKEAERALRKETELRPCLPRGRRNLISLLKVENRQDEAIQVATEWIETCQASGSLDAHRAYQDLMLAGGEREKLISDYRARLAEHPEVGANHYLYGRLLSEPDLSMSEHRESLRLDPQLAWARVALAYDLLALEQRPEAFRELTLAMSSPEHAPEAAYPYALAAVGAGALRDAQALLARLAKQHPDDGNVWESLWLVEMASERWSVAERMVRERASLERPVDAWQHRSKLLRLRGLADQVTQALATAEGQAELAEAAAAARFERLIEEGRYTEAAARLEQDFQEEGPPPLYRLYAAAGLMMAGDPLAAKGQLAQLAGDHGSDALEALARRLRGEISAEEAIRAARADHFLTLTHAYFMLGARAAYEKNRTVAAQFFEQSQASALDLSFPFEAARRLAGDSPTAKR